ncbi:MAG: xanthine dehydrogenase family protein molybdopterin-binding subunit [SAR202 cluster bacterium]|nr:xanthine dehydrogenase family protein molybdopterin-binding subunit [SAR202 cluster bacterium]
MAAYKPNVVLATKTFDVVGTRPLRHDGTDKVTGAAKYGADFNPVRLLYGRILRSPHAHARIKSIDASKALKLDGVKAVVTARDFPSMKAGKTINLGEGSDKLDYIRENVMASRKALYRGHAVAAVAATSPHIAEEALSLIKVEYEVLPPVLTAPEGADRNAPILHDNLFTEGSGKKPSKPSNVARRLFHAQGDVEKGFAKADVIVEREFTNKTVHQGYIEPHSAVAHWNQDGRVTVWCTTQAPFGVRDTTAELLDMPASQVRLIPTEIGGGFGGKIPVYLEPVAALLSKKTGAPVKIVMSRKEVLEGTGPTCGAYMKVKLGATRKGKMVAAQASLAYEAGAFPGSPVSAGAQCIFSCYDIPNMEVEGLDVVVNKPKTAAYRAPGAPNAAFAMEQMVDELARKLDLDQIEFRLMNASKEGARRVDGPTQKRIGLIEMLEAMKDHPHYKSKLKEPNTGRGVAIGFWFNVGLPSSCNVAVNRDGTINLVEGNPDIGGTRTSIAMQAAEVLGIPAEDVHPTVVDTDLIGYTALTAGSRTTFATGYAAYEAAQDAKRQLIQRAADIWDVDSKGVELKKGVYQSKTDPELNMTFKELAAKLDDTGGPIMGRGTVDPKGVGASVAGNIVDVRVDPETGKVDILRFTAFQDAGKAVHPSYVEGQMQGGSVQGIGWALNEEYFYNDKGDMANSSLLDYRMPTSLDLPMIDTVIIEVPNPGHPFGVRGVGEASIVPPMGAVANAIHGALGVRMTRLPMNPGAILETLWSECKNGRGKNGRK